MVCLTLFACPWDPLVYPVILAVGRIRGLCMTELWPAYTTQLWQKTAVHQQLSRRNNIHKTCGCFGCVRTSWSVRDNVWEIPGLEGRIWTLCQRKQLVHFGRTHVIFEKDNHLKSKCPSEATRILTQNPRSAYQAHWKEISTKQKGDFAKFCENKWKRRGIPGGPQDTVKLRACECSTEQNI